MPKFSQALLSQMADPGMFGKSVAQLGQTLGTLPRRQREEKQKAAAGRGMGELMALANNPQFDITDQKMQSGYFGMADAYGISREEAMKIALDVKKGKIDNGKVLSGRSAGQYKDEDGNYYEKSIVRTNRGEEGRWLPITPGAPPAPKGAVIPVGGAYKESASEKGKRDVDTAGRKTEAEKFAELRIEAVDNLPAIEKTIYSTQQSLEILDEIKTGGWSTALVRKASKFLGVEPQSEAEFNLLAGQQVLAGLNAFEGAISEGERQYLESLYQDLSNSKGANTGILTLMLDAAQRAFRDADTRAKSNTFQEYLSNRRGYSAPLTPQKKKVTFQDLQRGS